MKMIRRRGGNVYHLFQSMLSLVAGLKSRSRNSQIEFSPNGNSNIVGIRVDNQSRADALKNGQKHTFAGSIVSGMYKAFRPSTAEQIAEAQVSQQFGYDRKFFTGKLIDIFLSKKGELCILLGGVVTRRSQKDPNKVMWRAFNLDSGELLNVAVETFPVIAKAKPSAVKKAVQSLAKVKAKRAPKAKTVRKVKP